jgi:hypothetical protein
MMKGGKRFSIFDALQEAGHFAKNPANADAQDSEGKSIYKGPVQYPKLLYHPEGLMRISVPASAEMTPFGPQLLNEQRELVTRLVDSEESEAQAVAEGWHDHPAKAHVVANSLIAKRNAEIEALNVKREANGLAPLALLALRTIPPISDSTRVKDLEAQIKELEAKLQRTAADERALAPTTVAKPSVEELADELPLSPAPRPLSPTAKPLGRAEAVKAAGLV